MPYIWQKIEKAILKDLRSVNSILKKVHEKESRVKFKKIREKEELCVVVVCDASYHYADNSVGGELLILGNKSMDAAPLIFWKSGIIRKVCTSPKAAEIRALMKLVDDGTSVARQVSQLLNTSIKTRVFTDSRTLFESIGSLGQIEEKALRQSIAYLKQALEEGEIIGYSWIQGEEIVADIFTKQGSKRDALGEIIDHIRFRHSQTQDNLVAFEGDE